MIENECPFSPELGGYPAGKNEILTIIYSGLETTQTWARDYNSSRSNTISRALKAAPANHNTTRSNRTAP